MATTAFPSFNDHPEHVAARKQQNDFARYDQRLAEREIQLQDERTARQRATATTAADALEADASRAAEVVEGRVVDAVGIDQELASLAKSRRVLANGIKAQQQTISLIRSRLSAGACLQVMPECAAIAKEMAAALRTLGALESKSDDVRRRLELAGYDSGFLPSLNWPLIGRASDHDSLAWRRLRELDYIAKKHGA